MAIKKVLFILIFSSYLWVCSSNKTLNKPDIKNTPENTEIISDDYQNSHYEQSILKDDVETLRNLYNNALTSMNLGDIKGAQEFFEEALTIISNNEIKSSDIYKNNDDYNEIIDIILEDYENFINEEVKFYENPNAEIPGSDRLYKTIEPSLYHPSKNIPLVVNSRVKKYIKYYQGKGRKYFTQWLERMGKYKSLIEDILKEEGLPEDLVYLAMVESGFNPKAHSRARAVGIWQFISSTGRVYGLQINNYLDERKDPVKSTKAAAKFINNLYHELKDWYLVMAAYNVSKSKVKRAMKRYKSRNFWELKSLPSETKNHIPKFIAAAIIAKNPKKYGFRNIKYQKPFQYEEVHIDKCIDLTVAAKCARTDYLTIKVLNPELNVWFTPPYPDGYTLRIPPHKKEIFLKNYSKVPEDLKITRVIHKVKRGETLSYIARKYHTTIYNIKSVNSLKNIHKLSVGQKLLIPVPPPIEVALKTQKIRQKNPAYIPKNRNGLEKITYIVKKGDTLGEIAEFYNTRAGNIRKWNSLSYRSYIYPRQKLTLWLPKNEYRSAVNRVNNQNENITLNIEQSIEKNGSKAGKIYIVKKGDSLWGIAKNFGVSLNSLLQFNQKSKKSIIKPGEKIIIPLPIPD
ncbi:MAG: LysM peptidoglycan-binding domain-containing protein [Candidatus Helarchaeota archaeon]|nr:LysM peptidoglycan-binding domain-containing protein [Candidatus Helarchaeota archaeon]